jgi:hypothetical protein
MKEKEGIEILYNFQSAFSFNSMTNSFYFFGISPGDKIYKAVALLGQPREKVKSKGKMIHKFILRDDRDPYDRPFEVITAEFSTNTDIILSIKYEFRIEGSNRSIQNGLKSFTGTVTRMKGHPNQDAFLFKNNEGISLFSGTFFSKEFEGIFQTYILQIDNYGLNLKKLESEFSPSTLNEYYTAPFPADFFK